MSTLDAALLKKEAQLKELLQRCRTLAVAFSGGVDSTLLLDLAHEVWGGGAVALTARSVCFPKREEALAAQFCKERGIQHLICDFDLFAVSGFEENPPERCYLCKRALLELLLKTAEAQGSTVLAEGSNVDDKRDYRPGAAAIKELGVVSPLEAAGFTKNDIRALAQTRGLLVWDKPACACLATRLPFGVPITPELMQRIDAAEDFLLSSGAKQVRVRVHDRLARIELDEASAERFLEEELLTATSKHLCALGFESVVIDPAGYRMGSMNTVSTTR